jgi:DNA-binding helix-hairpin-helix protein with protein kinase domain
MTTAPATWLDDRGRTLFLAEEIGRGGEGVVYAVRDAPDLCAKVYSKLPDDDRVDKLVAMVEAFRRDPTLAEWCAWPRDLLLDGMGQVRGFVMDQLHDLVPVHDLYDPEERKRQFPLLTWQDLVRAAAFCAAMFGALHNHGVVVGDVNERNVLVRPDGRLHLVDCDSFQFSIGSRVFGTGVGVPDYTPPELQGADFSSLIRTENHDRFGLAVLCFKLVFMGRHPFAGGASGEIGPAIAAYDYAYPSVAAKLRHLLPLSAVDQQAMQLFQQAFVNSETSRPDAQTWSSTLTGLAESMRPCAVETMHRIAASSRQCPWCQIETVLHYQWFAPPDPEAWISGFSPELHAAEQQRAALDTISSPAKPEWWEEPPQLSAAVQLADRAVASGPKHDVASWYLRLLSGLSAVAGAALLATESALGRYLLPAGLVAWAGGFVWGRARLRPWKARLESLRLAADAVRHAGDDWRGEAWRRGEADRKLVLQFDQYFDRYTGLEQERRRVLGHMLADTPDATVVPALQKVSLETAALPPFVDQERRSSLRIRGLYSAADMTRERLAGVPGLTNQQVEALVRWRVALEVQAGGERRPPPSDDALQALDKRMEQERQRLLSAMQGVVDARQTASREAMQVLDDTWRKAEADSVALQQQADEVWRALSQLQ